MQGVADSQRYWACWKRLGQALAPKKLFLIQAAVGGRVVHLIDEFEYEFLLLRATQHQFQQGRRGGRGKLGLDLEHAADPAMMAA
ncbi:hypothetical protein AO240_15540 [Pseudomonas sp. ICMP 460]|nr:hypothetical protein AO240_15540 [Pseudomonas sp. ICMP 460]